MSRPKQGDLLAPVAREALQLMAGLFQDRVEAGLGLPRRARAQDVSHG